MIVTSDSTVLSAIIMAASTGRSTATKLPSLGATRAAPVNARPSPTTMTAGTISAPTSPSGSRAENFTPSGISFQSPRMSVSNGVAGHLEEHVLEARRLRPEIVHVDAVLRETVD